MKSWIIRLLLVDLKNLRPKEKNQIGFLKLKLCVKFFAIAILIYALIEVILWHFFYNFQWKFKFLLIGTVIWLWK